ncbi:DNA binding domain-containing protein, excisionase family [Ruminococcus sp. YE71]|uniref:helix-turn-helix domain-containing protein n=1 Tax=unclassified Ruminococcus TaxID=2608920 RepID=UPI000891D37D|nr:MULTISPECIES: helix-turn-helix domain-containing protein [unclassified Ruminococcus]SDA24873.1 DNA binding domain-containing protein, excisionase family [Ruminococcus sp. YE78]SFW43329.1 DNA binding domain-containing protein, excisionase family [Ruminococcus sp. YE71]
MDKSIDTVRSKSEHKGVSLPVVATIQEVEELTNLREFTIRNLIKQGKIIAMRSGNGKHGKYLINLESVRDYLNAPW